MRIAFVSETWVPQVNGVALTVNAMARGMAARGHCVEVVRPGGAGREQGLEMVAAAALRMPRYPELQFGLPCAARLRRRWNALRPDVVYVATEGFLGASALCAARGLRIPVVTGLFYEHSGQPGALSVYCATLAVCGYVNAAMWAYAALNPTLMHAESGVRESWEKFSRAAVAPVILTCVALSNTSAALVVAAILLLTRRFILWRFRSLDT